MWVRIPPRAFILEWRCRSPKEIVPELPEVQIMVNQLARRLERGRIRAIEVRDAKIKLRHDVAGQLVLRVWRAGKNIVFDLSGGLHLLAHLRMTGWFELRNRRGIGRRSRPAGERRILRTVGVWG